MDGQITIDDVIKVAIAVSAGLGGILGPLFIIRWAMNGKARRNAMEMTPGMAPKCEDMKKEIAKVKDRVLVLETKARSDSK